MPDTKPDPLKPTTTPGSSAATGSAAGSQMNAAEMTSHDVNASAGSESAREMAEDTASAARSRAAELGERAKAEARGLGDQALGMAEAKVDEAKGYATSEIDRQAESIRNAGREFGDDSYQARAADYLASNLQQAADVIRSKDLGTMVDDISTFARRNPGVFLGGAAVLGFAAARLLKATERSRPNSGYYGDGEFDAPQTGVANTYHDTPGATPQSPLAPASAATPGPVSTAPSTPPGGRVR